MIVFLTLYLGLINGRQPVALQVDAAVKSVRIVIDGATVATINGPPWRGEVDFGGELVPHTVVAVGLDGTGREIARASQFVNVPRPIAEIDVALARDAGGTPTGASLVARHLGQEKPRSATLTLDDTALAVDRDFKAALPVVDMKRPHVLAAEMRFADGAVARREVAFGGQYAESTEAELTPIAVVRTGASDVTPAEGCFVANGVPLRVRTIEQTPAQVIIVRENDTRMLANRLLRGSVKLRDRSVATLEAGTLTQLLAPVPERVGKKEEVTTLFPMSANFDAAKVGLLYQLTVPHSRRQIARPQWADAVAVAAVRAAASGRRRAVVLVYGSGGDKSDYQPTVIRKYLGILGVPLAVWSSGNPTPPPSWGDVHDISSVAALTAATESLRRELDAQRIAWIYADPITALYAEVKEGCGYTRLH